MRRTSAPPAAVVLKAVLVPQTIATTPIIPIRGNFANAVIGTAATTDPAVGQSPCLRARSSSSVAAAVEPSSARFAREVAVLDFQMLPARLSFPVEHLFNLEGSRAFSIVLTVIAVGGLSSDRPG